MQATRFLVISDLHISDEKSIFHAQEALIALVKYAGEQPENLELVILGDGLDYLTMDPELVFTKATAEQKTTKILEYNKKIFAALKEFLTKNNKRLSWFIGNHDVELVFDSVRAAIEKVLGVEASSMVADVDVKNRICKLPEEPKGGTKLVWYLSGRPRLLQTGGAAEIGLVHGNQADPWNEIDYDEAIKIAGQGGDDKYKYPDGSLLVVNVLNQLKKQGFGFIDLLKPETSVALPLMLALWPDQTKRLIGKAFPLAKDQTIKSLTASFFNTPPKLLAALSK